jgi:hypothetical protein
MPSAADDAPPLDAARAARRLRDATEPLAASVYFAPECHDAYHRLGFDPSPGVATVALMSFMGTRARKTPGHRTLPHP